MIYKLQKGFLCKVYKAIWKRTGKRKEFQNGMEYEKYYEFYTMIEQGYNELSRQIYLNFIQRK